MLLKVLSVHLMSLLVNNNETPTDADESEADTEQEQIQGITFIQLRYNIDYYRNKMFMENPSIVKLKVQIKLHSFHL